MLKNQFLFIVESLKLRLMSDMEYKLAFLLQVGGMILNNAFFVLVWRFIFNFSGNNINGWQFIDQLYLLVLSALAYGVCFYFGGGIKELPKYIYTGSLDKFLLLPKNLLLQISLSKSQLSSLGDLFSGFILFLFIADINLIKFLTVVFLWITGGIIFWAVWLLGGSLSFWLGNSEKIAHNMFDSTMQFSIYPGSLYSGLLKIVIFVMFPAGLVVVLPVEILQTFLWQKAAYFILGIFLWIAIPIFIFYQGLKRYSSGNQINVTN